MYLDRVALQVENVFKSFGSLQALHDVSLHARKGEIVGILGPNAAGKTTLLRIISGIIKPDAGRIVIHNVDLSKHPREAKQHIGIVPEGAGLIDKLTPREYFQFIGGIYGISKQEFALRIREVTKLFDIAHLQDSLIEGLSKGQKQKIAIASAFLHSPSILLLDEPTANLDIESQIRVRQLFVQYAKHRRNTILIASHVLANIEGVCDRVYIIGKGRILYEGRVEDLLSRGKGSLENAYVQIMRGSEG